MSFEDTTVDFFDDIKRDEFFTKIHSSVFGFGIFKEEIYKPKFKDISVIVGEKLSDNQVEVCDVRSVNIKTYFFFYKIVRVESARHLCSCDTNKLFIKYKDVKDHRE